MDVACFANLPKHMIKWWHPNLTQYLKSDYSQLGFNLMQSKSWKMKIYALNYSIYMVPYMARKVYPQGPSICASRQN